MKRKQGSTNLNYRFHTHAPRTSQPVTRNPEIPAAIKVDKGDDVLVSWR